jgi:hypothetical protein
MANPSSEPALRWPTGSYYELWSKHDSAAAHRFTIREPFALSGVDERIPDLVAHLVERSTSEL